MNYGILIYNNVFFFVLDIIDMFEKFECLEIYSCISGVLKNKLIF